MANNFEQTEFGKRYPQAIEEYRKAQKRLAEGSVSEALTAARRALEFIVKEFCKKSGQALCENGKEVPLVEMIDKLGNAQLLDKAEVSTLHQLRMKCNLGVHQGDIPPTLEDAQWGVDLLTEVLEIFQRHDDDSTFIQKKKDSNVPMMLPDYYDEKRRYRGDWYNKYSRADLFAIKAYIDLQKKADGGDISAMLDLAIGFLPKKNAFFSKDQLVCMPKYIDRNSSYYNEDAYDARYYYWIIRACDQAVCNEEQDVFWPKKYMATAFLEAIKFILHVIRNRNLYVSSVQRDRYSYNGEPNKIEKDQYKLVEEIYNVNLPQIDCSIVAAYGKMLLDLIEESASCDIIAPLHQENTISAIKYFMYCWSYLTGEPLSHWQCICEKDEGTAVTAEMLRKIRPNSTFSKFVENILRDGKAREQKREAERQEEERRRWILENPEEYQRQQEELRRKEEEKKAKRIEEERLRQEKYQRQQEEYRRQQEELRRKQEEEKVRRMEEERIRREELEKQERIRREELEKQERIRREEQAKQEEEARKKKTKRIVGFASVR